MHIAMVSDYYLPTLGGVQTSIKAAKESLALLGHRVTVFCPLLEESADPDVVGLPISGVFRPDGFPFSWPPQQLLAFMRTEMLRRGVDVVHVHSEVFAALAGIRAARELGLPLVQSMHGRIDVYTAKVLPVPEISTVLLAQLQHHQLPQGPPAAHPEAPYMRTAVARRMWRLMITQANAADAVVVPSAHFAAKLQHQGVVSPLHVISNSLEDSVVARIGAPQRPVRNGSDPLRAMWCGRLSPEKRPEAFVEAVASAGEHVTAGIYGDGLARPRVARLVERLGVGHRVRLHGSVPQEEVLHAMRNHDVIVSSSHDFDNQPMVILEALASGLPILLCDPDLAERLPQGGYLISNSPHPQQLSAALQRLAAEPELLERMGRAVAEGASQAAGANPARKLEEVYAGLLTAR